MIAQLDLPISSPAFSGFRARQVWAQSGPRLSWPDHSGSEAVVKGDHREPRQRACPLTAARAKGTHGPHRKGRLRKAVAHLGDPNLVCSTDFSGSAQANKAPSLATTTYCRPSSSYVIGEFPTCPMAECQSVAPSLVRSAITLRTESPVKVKPESVVRTPAAAPPPPRSWFQRIFPLW